MFYPFLIIDCLAPEVLLEALTFCIVLIVLFQHPFFRTRHTIIMDPPINIKDESDTSYKQYYATVDVSSV